MISYKKLVYLFKIMPKNIYFANWLAFFICLYLSKMLNDIFLFYFAILYILAYHIMILPVSHYFKI